MTEVVTSNGTDKAPTIVNFGSKEHRMDHHHRDGWTGKDATFAQAINSGEQTRDILQATRFESNAVLNAVKASELATEKTGAANQLATEKTAAATQLSIEKIAAAGILEATKNAAAILAAQAACCCELKELIRAEAGQTRDLINANTVQDLRDRLAATQRLLPVTVGLPL